MVVLYRQSSNRQYPRATPRPGDRGVRWVFVMVLANARVVTVHGVLDPGWLTIDGPRIAGVGRGDPPALDGDVHDLAGHHVLPGFIDLHMHGGGGAQITTDDPDE